MSQITGDRRSAALPRWVVLGSGIGLVGACIALGRIPNLVVAPRAFLVLFGLAFACYGAGLWAIAHAPRRMALFTLVAVAALCRVALFPSTPTLSTDAYRYVWDARVASAGLSPYAAAPNAPELAHLRDTVVYPRLNHSTWRTIYPPGAQFFFRAVYALVPDSVMAMKSAIVLAELATLAVLASLLARLAVPFTQLAVYAWNPLVLVEVWGSGHLDGLVVLFVVAAVHLALAGRATAAASMLGLGTLVKIYPALLVPLFLGGGVGWPVVAFALVVLAGYAPFVSLGGGALGSLPQYVSTEYFNPGLARTLAGAPTLTLIALGAWVAIASFWRRQASLVERSIVLITGFIVLSPNVFPWYALWLVPFLAVRPSVACIAFTGTLGLAYTFFLSQPWVIPVWARVAELAPLVVGGAWAVTRSRLANRSAASMCLTSRPAPGGPA